MAISFRISVGLWSANNAHGLRVGSRRGRNHHARNRRRGFHGICRSLPIRTTKHRRPGRVRIFEGISAGS